jgi:hypothetical protein
MSLTHYKTLLENEFIGQWDLADGEGGFKRSVVCIEKVARYVPKRRKRKQVMNLDGTAKKDTRGQDVYEEEKNKKLAIYFRGKRKPALFGPTVQAVIAGLYGSAIEGWIGKHITLYVDPEVKFGTTKTGGLRVESRKPNPGQATHDPLDKPVDEAKAKQIADASDSIGREPGEEG